jgi:hypothetical protein
MRNEHFLEMFREERDLSYEQLLNWGELFNLLNIPGSAKLQEAAADVVRFFSDADKASVGSYYRRERGTIDWISASRRSWCRCPSRRRCRPARPLPRSSLA